MELDLKKVSLDTYQNAGEFTVSQEETLETIVPDYSPDIARIIKSEGKVFLHSRELRDGKAEISGTIRVNVLYVPDGEHGIKSLEFAVPFRVESDNRMLYECQQMLSETESEFLETRMLNPRKIFTRCRLLTRITGYRKEELEYCSDIEVKEEHCIEKRREKQTVMLLTQIAEKDFTFSGEVSLSPGKEGAVELLGNHVSWVVTETKIVGNKLVFKGIFLLSLLYRSADGKCGCFNEELPFSQIMEVEAATEGAEVSLNLQVTGSDLQIDGDDPEGRQFAVTVYLRASALLREKREVILLSDLYSTAHELKYEAQSLSLTEFRDTTNRRQMVREVLEIGTMAESVLLATVGCGAVSAVREGESIVLRTLAEVKVLYLGEGGAPLLAERSVNVSCQLELPEDCKVKACAGVKEEVQWNLGERGIEIRFPVDFLIEVEKQVKRVCVSSVNIDLESIKDSVGVPSLVLRSIGKQESAWDLAKKYNSTITEILTANQLEEEPLPQGKLLLIPRKRN